MNSLKRSQKALNAFIMDASEKGLLDAETIRLFEQGDLTLKDTSLYIAKEITGNSGIIKLIDDQTTLSVGVTNMDKAKLAKAVNAIVQGIEVQYGIHATETDPTKIISWTPVRTSFDPALLAAEITVSVGGENIIHMPVMDVLLGAVDAESQVYRALSVWKFIGPDTPIRINLEFPSGEAVGDGNTNKHHIRVKLVTDLLGPK